jgi:hypothetical protein
MENMHSTIKNIVVSEVEKAKKTMYKHREEKKTREIVKFVILFYRIIFLKYCCFYIFRCIILKEINMKSI